jgi:hypothetical protein
MQNLSLIRRVKAYGLQRRMSLKGRFLAFVALAAVLGLMGVSRLNAAQPRAGSVPVSPPVLTVGPGMVGPPVPARFLGLSIEYWAFANYAGEDPGAVDPVFVQLLRNLSSGSTTSLRIGGVTTDRTWWPVAGLGRPPGVNYTLTPSRLTVIKEVAQAVGARLIMGVNFEANNPLLAAGEARAMNQALGPNSIEGFELGNEPELYGSWGWYRDAQGREIPGRPAGWDIHSFTRDFARVAGAMHFDPLAGPATGANGWLKGPGLGSFIASEPRLRVFTIHRYPLQACYFPKGSPRYPTIGQLLSPTASSTLAQSVVPFLTLAHAHHVPLRIDEMNNISCGAAPGVSNTFAMALWAIDALFSDLKVGVDGVNMHTYPGADYQLFAVNHTGTHWRAAVYPEYYGLLMFSQAAPPGSHLLQVSGAGGTLRAWATHAPDGRTRVVLINDNTANPQTVTLRVPGTVGIATLARLQAPSAHATSGVTLAGQNFGSQTSSGALLGPLSTSLLTASPSGDYSVQLPAASAALLTFG